MTSINKFVVDVPQGTLDDLHDRLKRTRWAAELDDGWTFGTDREKLRASSNTGLGDSFHVGECGRR